MDLLVTAKEIKGHCPTFAEGDAFTLKEGYQLVSKVPVCMHALAALMPFYNALRISKPARWGLAGKILMAWIFTLPICFAAGWLIAELFLLVG